MWNVEDFVKSKEKALTDLSPDSTGFSQYSWLNPPSLFRNVFDDILDKSFERGILIHALFYLLQGVNHRGMVSRAEFLAIAFIGSPVMLRTTYSATCLAWEIGADRLFDRISSGVTERVRATSLMIRSTVIGTG